MPSSSGSETQITEVDGWIVDDMEKYEYFFSNPAPRKFGLWRQIKVDISTLQGARLILAGTFAILVGSLAQSIWVILLGSLILYRYASILLIVVRGYESSILTIGTIRELNSRHPIFKEDFLTSAICDDGKVIPVVISERIASPLFRTYGCLQAAALYDGAQEYALAIAARPPLPTADQNHPNQPT
jgi:hypothetical protein